ncbi:hypothetical protein ACETU7_05420 [Rhodococcus sp. 3Y1]
MLPESTVIIDCGADFRLQDPAAWEKYYKVLMPVPGPTVFLVPGAVRVVGATRIAVPGCYPTAASLALAPPLPRDRGLTRERGCGQWHFGRRPGAEG